VTIETVFQASSLRERRSNILKEGTEMPNRIPVRARVMVTSKMEYPCDIPIVSRNFMGSCLFFLFRSFTMGVC
jgi:hypothetical protein